MVDEPSIEEILASLDKLLQESEIGNDDAGKASFPEATASGGEDNSEFERLLAELPEEGEPAPDGTAGSETDAATATREGVAESGEVEWMPAQEEAESNPFGQGEGEEDVPQDSPVAEDAMVNDGQDFMFEDGEDAMFEAAHIDLEPSGTAERLGFPETGAEPGMAEASEAVAAAVEPSAEQRAAGQIETEQGQVEPEPAEEPEAGISGDEEESSQSGPFESRHDSFSEDAAEEASELPDAPYGGAEPDVSAAAGEMQASLIEERQQADEQQTREVPEALDHDHASGLDASPPVIHLSADQEVDAGGADEALAPGCDVAQRAESDAPPVVILTESMMVEDHQPPLPFDRPASEAGRDGAGETGAQPSAEPNEAEGEDMQPELANPSWPESMPAAWEAAISERVARRIEEVLPDLVEASVRKAMRKPGRKIRRRRRRQ